MSLYQYEIDLDKGGSPSMILSRVGKNKKVLEVGSASGSQTKILTEQLGCSVTAIEVVQESADIAKQYCEQMIVGDIEQLDLNDVLGDQYFDVVLFADVLEHLRDPASVLAKLKPYFADGGYAVAAIPNIVHASVIMEMALGHFDYRDEGLLDATHIHFFTRASVYEVFERAGFLITGFDRLAKQPERTEFKTSLYYKDADGVLEFIKRHNSEWNTYKFIIEARTVENNFQADVISQQDRIREMEEEIRGLKSVVSWYSDPWWNRILSSVSQKLGIGDR